MAEINPQTQSTVSFIAVVSQFLEQSYKGRNFYRMVLKQHNGTIHQAFAWEDQYQGNIFSYPVEVVATVVKRQLNGEARIQVLSLSEDLDTIQNLNNVFPYLVNTQTLNAQQKQGLQKLNLLLDAIQTPLIKQFLMRILAQPEIIHPFIQLPASINHHHNTVGGLLVHSIECAEFVFQATLNSKLPVEERELATIAALLHDIGKIKTFSQDGKKHSVLGHHLSHEQLTLLVLAPFLKELETQWPHGSALLMQFLVWDKRQKSFPSNPTNLLIKTADQLSTGMDIREKSFIGKPERFYFTKFNTGKRSQFVNRLISR